MRGFRILLFVSLLIGGAGSGNAQFGAPITDTQSIEPDLYIDTSDDSMPSLATDGNGTWVAAWITREQCAPKGSYVVATSFDGGVSWTSPIPLDPTGPISVEWHHLQASIATDGNGNWVAVWSSRNTLGDTIGTELDILVATSADAGLTWSAPAPLNNDAAVDGNRFDYDPRVATDGAGVWIAIWDAAPVAAPPGQFSEHDIFIARSFDNGVTWTDSRFVNKDALTDDRHDWFPELATDGNGTWVVFWDQYDYPALDGIWYSRSANSGLTWSDPQSLAGDDNYLPKVAAGGAGNWMAVWGTQGGPYGSDYDVVFSASADDGVSWTIPAAVNTTATGDIADDHYSALASDRHGNWVVVWGSEDDMNGTIGGDKDLMVARSNDLGLTWTEPEPVNSDAGVDSDAPDGRPWLVADGRANWITAWTKSEVTSDVKAAMFRLPFAETCSADSDGDGFGAPGDPACPLGDATDCDDGDIWVGPAVPDICDGLNNDCADSSWPSLPAPEIDDDGDGLSECDSDCDDADGQIWGRPGEVLGLMLGKDGSDAVLLWPPPDRPGGTPESLLYDVLRYAWLGDWCPPVNDPGTCLVSDQPGTTAIDAALPDPGDVLFYLIRADNACERRSGPIGVDSSGRFRFGSDCP